MSTDSTTTNGRQGLPAPCSPESVIEKNNYSLFHGPAQIGGKQTVSVIFDSNKEARDFYRAMMEIQMRGFDKEND